jgi:hypothetical protein
MRGAGKRPVMIPLPYGLNVIVNTGRAAGALSRRAVEPGAAARSMAADLFTAFNPLGSDAHFYVPTAIKPFIESEVNEDWRGAPIVPEPFPGTTPKPPAERYWRSAPEWAKKTARFLNERSGGDEVTPGYISVSPETLDHYFKFGLSGIARFVDDSLATKDALAKGEAPSPRTTPLVRDFVYEPAPSLHGTQYREAVAEIDTAWTRYQHYRKRGEYGKITSELPAKLLRVKPAVDQIEKRIRDLQKRGKAAGRNVDAEVERLQVQVTRAVNEARAAQP